MSNAARSGGTNEEKASQITGKIVSIRSFTKEEEESRPRGKDLIRRLLGKTMRFELSDGRIIVGEMQCMDYLKNFILHDAVETQYPDGQGSEPNTREFRSVMVPGKHLVRCQVLEQHMKESLRGECESEGWIRPHQPETRPTESSPLSSSQSSAAATSSSNDRYDPDEEQCIDDDIKRGKYDVCEACIDEGTATEGQTTKAEATVVATVGRGGGVGERGTEEEEVAPPPHGDQKKGSPEDPKPLAPPDDSDEAAASEIDGATAVNQDQNDESETDPHWNDAVNILRRRHITC